VTCAAAALVVGGAATASAAPPGQEVIPLDCGSAGTFDIVTNGNGMFTPGRRLDSTGVIVPTSFGEFTLSANGTVVATDPGSAKGGGNVASNNAHPSVSCTFSLTETLAEDQEVVPGVVLPAGTEVTFSGSVTGFLTGRP
jgi:hypothetical protein